MVAVVVFEAVAAPTLGCFVHIFDDVLVGVEELVVFVVIVFAFALVLEPNDLHEVVVGYVGLAFRLGWPCWLRPKVFCS